MDVRQDTAEVLVISVTKSLRPWMVTARHVSRLWKMGSKKLPAGRHQPRPLLWRHQVCHREHGEGWLRRMQLLLPLPRCKGRLLKGGLEALCGGRGRAEQQGGTSDTGWTARRGSPACASILPTGANRSRGSSLIEGSRAHAAAAHHAGPMWPSSDPCCSPPKRPRQQRAAPAPQPPSGLGRAHAGEKPSPQPLLLAR